MDCQVKLPIFMVSWLLRCMEEFFKQGDKEQEQGLDFSPLCDRQTTMVPQSQIGVNHSSLKYVKVNFYGLLLQK